MSDSELSVQKVCAVSCFPQQLCPEIGESKTRKYCSQGEEEPFGVRRNIVSLSEVLKHMQLFIQWQFAGWQTELRPKQRVCHKGWATCHKACLKSKPSSTGGGKHRSSGLTLWKRLLPQQIDLIFNCMNKFINLPPRPVYHPISIQGCWTFVCNSPNLFFFFKLSLLFPAKSWLGSKSWLNLKK